MASLLLLVLLFCILQLSYSAVVDLNEESFDSLLAEKGGEKGILVEFFAPWCGHCKNLAPEWKIAGDTFTDDDPIVIAAVDATVSPALAKRFDVKGYPTIKFFPKGSTTPIEYDGGRTADTIIKWVNTNVGTNRKVKSSPSAVTVLTTENFDRLTSGKGALVEFYAPWCGHCKQLTPKYEKLAQVFAGEKDVLVAKVDATEENDLANKYDVSGYPTIKYFPKDGSEPVSYEGAREVEDFVKYINEKAGTLRTPEGNLLPEAGRVKELDEHITATKAIDDDLLKKLTAAAEKLTGAAATHAKHYLTFAKNIIAKGADYPTKEKARLLKMVSNGNVNPDSKTLFLYKINILGAFE